MSLMLLVVLFFLAAALLLYAVFAGADFGAGILELFIGRDRRDEQQRLISHAMAPVWEANHVWLVLVVVILFVGFPQIYTALSTYLHLPLMAVLMGIVARGCAFTFRHYDTLNARYYRAYSHTFALSSLWTAFFLGVLGGATILGRIDPAGADYAALYLAPWLNPFCAVLGLFTCALFALLAAVFLVGEARDPELRRRFERRALAANLVLVPLGAAVFLTAELQGLGLLRLFLSQPISVASVIVATVLLFPFWRLLRRSGRPTPVRLLAVAMAALILFGWYASQFPVAVRLASGALTFPGTVSPEATLRALFWALLVGSLLIFPALAYLMKVFKWETFEREQGSAGVKRP